MKSTLSHTLLKNQKKNLSIGQVIYFLKSLIVMHTMLQILGVTWSCGDTSFLYMYQSQTMAHSLLKYQQNMQKKNYFTAWHLNNKMYGFYTHTKEVTMQV
jgi:hypothetical protein